MREWLYALVPIGLAIYFVLFPDQFGALISFLR
jgi:hypothetical protein